MSCSSASACTPIASASLARGLSSAWRSSMSAGSTSLNRKALPFVMRKGSENLLDLLITSLVFMSSSPSHLPAASERLVKLHHRQQLVALRLGKAQLGGKQISVSVERLEQVRNAPTISHVGQTGA